MCYSGVHWKRTRPHECFLNRSPVNEPLPTELFLQSGFYLLPKHEVPVEQSGPPALESETLRGRLLGEVLVLALVPGTDEGSAFLVLLR